MRITSLDEIIGTKYSEFVSQREDLSSLFVPEQEELFISSPVANINISCDKDISKAVEIFNNKGYYTLNSCQGHFAVDDDGNIEDLSQPYIQFKYDQKCVEYLHEYLPPNTLALYISKTDITIDDKNFKSDVVGIYISGLRIESLSAENVAKEYIARREDILDLANAVPYVI